MNESIELLRKDAERHRWLREHVDDCQWMNILRVDLEDFASLDDAFIIVTGKQIGRAHV